MVNTSAAVAILALAIWMVLQNAEAKEALHTWFFDRMLKRISSDPTENSHFYILEGLFTEQLPALILIVLAILIFRAKQIKNEVNKAGVVLFLLLGFAGSLPLMLTLVQRNFYFIPALPVFAIAWSLLIADGLNRVLDNLNGRPKLRTGLTIFSGLALITGLTATIIFAGRIKREKEMLQDVYTIRKLVPPNSFVSVTSDVMWMDWSFRCYMMRYDEISFSDKDTCVYFIARSDEPVAGKFIPTNAPLHKYRLYKISTGK